MLITYGVEKDNFDPYSCYYARLNREKAKAMDNPLVYKKQMLTAEKERLEKQLCDVNAELKKMELELSEKVISRMTNKGLSKKEMIIELYINGLPSEKIQEYVDTDKSYVQKVLSCYRKQNGVQKTTKGARTKSMIIDCLDSGKTVEETALHLGVSVQYVYRVKKANAVLTE